MKTIFENSLVILLIILIIVLIVSKICKSSENMSEKGESNGENKAEKKNRNDENKGKEENYRNEEHTGGEEGSGEKNENNYDEKLYDDTVVRIRVQKLDFDWKEPYIKTSSYESIGTGFFINDKSELLTNFHVVNKGIKVHIQLPKLGNKTFECDIISVYPKLDLALIRVKDFKNKKYLEFGDSEIIKKGDNVIALGYPLGQNKLKITSGIVSGYQDGDIQTDSPINPGNSGGPLVNTNNKVIGINYAGYDEAQNIGYAIPIEYVKINLPTMYKKNFINYPVLSCTFNNTNDTIMKFSSLCNEGYYIAKVLKNGTMENAGIKEGDILCKFDNIKIDNYGELFLPKPQTKFHLSDYLNYKKVGDVVDIEIIRNIKNKEGKKEKKKVIVKLNLLPNTYYKIRDMYPEYDNIEYQILGGMVIMELSNNHLEFMKNNKDIQKYNIILNKNSPKLVISHIIKGSKLSEDNIFKAPLILEKVNNMKVNTIKELKTALKEYQKDGDVEYMTFLTENSKFLVLDLKKTKEEELFLSKNFNYQITKYTKELLRIDDKEPFENINNYDGNGNNNGNNNNDFYVEPILIPSGSPI